MQFTVQYGVNCEPRLHLWNLFEVPLRCPQLADSAFYWLHRRAGYEKLKPYGFTVHAGIDGGSNFIVYATLALNKSSSSIFTGYRSAVEQYGRPGRVRADMAFEALAVGQDMLDHRGPGAYITGASVHNQVVESQTYSALDLDFDPVYIENSVLSAPYGILFSPHSTFKSFSD